MTSLDAPTVTFEDVEVYAASDRALLVFFPEIAEVRSKQDAKVWVPRSVIDDVSEVFKKGDKGMLCLARWFAEKEELLVGEASEVLEKEQEMAAEQHRELFKAKARSGAATRSGPSPEAETLARTRSPIEAGAVVTLALVKAPGGGVAVHVNGVEVAPPVPWESGGRHEWQIGRALLERALEGR